MNSFFQKNQNTAYYLVSIVVLGIITALTNTFYSQVFTFTTVTALTICFALAIFLRPYIEHMLVDSHPYLEQPIQQLKCEFSIYVIIGFIIFIVEIILNKHTILISSKLFSCVLILGYFASIESALKREHECFIRLHNNQSNVKKNISVSRRISLFITITLLVVILANALSAYSYMSLEYATSEKQNKIFTQLYLLETLFILAIVVTLTLRLIHSYSVNLQHLFDIQIDALQQIQNGNLENYIPVLSRDEFGVIAQKTNLVIDELREKEKISKTLQSIVSPDIMKKLMMSDSSALKHGEKKHIAVFFCDLRKFTTYTEKNSPEDVIFFLNSYFGKIVDIVSEHNGVVNKFMGDAILAIFHLDNETATIDDAVETALDIVMHSHAICLPDGDRFNVGIGIHIGYATAGTIGSQDRFEYTFIGDTVNIASRLDGLSKRLGYSIIISEDTYINLNPKTQEKFTDLGKQKIRGKETPLHVYGASTIQYIEH